MQRPHRHSPTSPSSNWFRCSVLHMCGDCNNTIVRSSSPDGLLGFSMSEHIPECCHSQQHPGRLCTCQTASPPAVQAEAMTDSIYRFFMQRVAEGRGLSAEATRAVAKGRVWSGGSLLCCWWTLWTSCSVQF
jgi:Peptidase family S49